VRLSVKVSYGGETKSAELTILSYTRLTVKMTGDGYGRVTSSPAGLQCDSGDCASPFSDGQAVRLTPLPKAGTVFGGWSGDCDGQGRVTVTGPVTCTAKFSRQ
jgi:hypothetical protein